ncbi:MAG: GNAT family N-acetyltransferase [Stenotrophobium sp.]
MTNLQSSPSDFASVTLEGTYVVLEPLAAEHHEALSVAGADEAIFRWYPVSYSGAAQMREFITHGVAEQRAGRALPFAVRTRHDGCVVGSTRFAAIERTHRRAEIGWTWYAPAVQRTPVNTECKYLLLRHAFETLGLNRVEFKTDSLNDKSRAALLRIGATQEGIFRNHMVMQGGRIRHSVYFAVVREEWPQMRENLERRLAQPFSFQSQL